MLRTQKVALAALLCASLTAFATTQPDVDIKGKQVPPGDVAHNLIIFATNGSVTTVPYGNLQGCWLARTVVLQTRLVLDAICSPSLF